MPKSLMQSVGCIALETDIQATNQYYITNNNFYLYHLYYYGVRTVFDMGNILIDLDARFSKFQFKYLELYPKGLFEMAANILYQANSNLPMAARVLDLPQFRRQGTSLRDEMANQTLAEEYCNEWGPLVWQSIADYCETMLQQLQD